MAPDGKGLWPGATRRSAAWTGFRVLCQMYGLCVHVRLFFSEIKMVCLSTRIHHNWISPQNFVLEGF